MGISLDILHRVICNAQCTSCVYPAFYIALMFSHAGISINITLNGVVIVEYDGEYYIATVTILVSHHNNMMKVKVEHFTFFPAFSPFREMLRMCARTYSESWNQMSHSAVTYSLQMEL